MTDGAMNDAIGIARCRAEAVRLHRAGQLDDAERLYRQILLQNPANLQARHMMGVLRLQQSRAAQALQLLAVLIAEAPGDADIRTHHGLVLQALGRRQEALADFERALALRPGHAPTLLYRSNLMLELGRFAEALDGYDILLGRDEGNAEAWFRRGAALLQLGRSDEALASYDEALGFNPDHFAALFNRGTVLLRLERYDEAFAAYEKARALSPHHPLVLGGAASALLSLCDLARWEEFRARVVAAVKTRSAVIAPLTFLPFCDDAALRRTCAEIYVAAQLPPSAPLWTGERTRHDRIRIAYLSADFHQHATAALMAEVFERHDRTRFEVTGISFSRDDGSQMRARLIKGFDRFVDVRDKSDAEVAQLLREADIDIAVDLKGHTDGARPGILAHRCCPVQVNYLGYPGTIGARWLDYIIADRAVVPFDQQPFYSEKIVHLPHCYQANGARAIGETPTRAIAGLPEAGFVFCCFNAAWKFSPALFDIWMRLLQAVPGSVLWLLEDNRPAAANLKTAAAERGVDPERLVFAPPAAPPEHLARQALADLFLDTLPYNAHTTASDALWVGLPLVTALGRSFDGRVAGSLLLAVGLPELVAETLEDYESLALALARDPARLARVRHKLRENRLTAPLFDTGLFCRHLEAAYVRMVETVRRGDAAQSFAVPP